MGKKWNDDVFNFNEKIENLDIWELLLLLIMMWSDYEQPTESPNTPQE